MQNDTILLEVKNLNKTFPVKKEKLYAVSDVSFSLKKGECLGIVGESGCGKSTVARMIAGIIPVSGGEVLLEGEAYMNLKGSEKKTFPPKHSDGFPGSFKFIQSKNESWHLSYGIQEKL